MRPLKLGLIGVDIANSRAPLLHRLAGRLCGIEVSYDLIAQTSALPETFRKALSYCQSQGYHAVNVTHPFKEYAAQAAKPGSEQVRRLGAVNTVRFGPNGELRGFNTDYTGFRRAFESRFKGRRPGTVAILGSGGVGRAIAFGLADLGAEEIRLFDQDRSRSERLAAVLGTQTGRVRICDTVEAAVADVAGLINATPVGMYSHPGTPLPKALITNQSWAFDAVYTPLETRFLLDAADSGLQILSGYELFFHQGVDAFEGFSGIRVDEARLREELRRATSG